MAHPATYVIIEDGEAVVSRDEVGALGCLFALDSGPVACVEVAAAATPVEEGVPAADGGFLVDFDAQRCLVFGDVAVVVALPDEAHALADAARLGPQALFAHVREAWEGWNLEWVSGVEAFAAYVRQR